MKPDFPDRFWNFALGALGFAIAFMLFAAAVLFAVAFMEIAGS